MASQFYNLCWASGKGIERSVTDDLSEAKTMAKVMSRSSEEHPAQTIMIVDDRGDVAAFFRDAVEYTRTQ